MSGAFNACFFVVVAALTATRVQQTVSAAAVFPPDDSSGALNDNDGQKTSLPLSEDVPSSKYASEQSEIDDDSEENIVKLLPLSGDIERRRANFRGDLGKRNQRTFAGPVHLAVAAARRGMRTAKSRLRPDLGKRSPMSGAGAAIVGGRFQIDSRMAGMRRRFRPDLGKRGADDEVAVDDESYSLWPSYRGVGPDGDLMTQEANLRNAYAYRQAAEDDEDEPEVLSASAKRGRSGSSSFRGDLGKRRSPSSFRGDLGKRRRRSTDGGERNGWQSPEVSRFPGGYSVDEDEIDRRLAKRVRANAKSTFRGDLGKRRSSFRGDLGKRDPPTSPTADGATGFVEEDVFGLPSGPEDIEKRPRTSSSFRGDLGKRDTPEAARGGAGIRSTSSFVKRPRPQSFRGDLGKRSTVEPMESRANGFDGDGKSAAATAHD